MFVALRRGREALARPLSIGLSFVLLSILSNCTILEGGPERLYSVSEEVTRARALLDGSGSVAGVTAQYYVAAADAERMHWRNEIIARRMYIIDVEYSEYEAALTSERQKFAFASSVTAQGLNTAGALVVPATTTKILSGLAGAVTATKGFYDSELVIAKTLQIAEAQMRAERDRVGARILQRRSESAVTYPLSAALSDLEDYYRAGTLNSGIIKAAADAGEAAKEAAAIKETVISYGSNASTVILNACVKRLGAQAAQKLAAVLPSRNSFEVATLLGDITAKGNIRRAALLEKAKAAGVCP